MDVLVHWLVMGEWDVRVKGGRGNWLINVSKWVINVLVLCVINM